MLDCYTCTLDVSPAVKQICLPKHCIGATPVWLSGSQCRFDSNPYRRSINFKSLTDNIDSTSSAGRFFFHIMASLAEMERELIAERTRAGLAAARKLGRVGGRRRVMTESKINSARKLLKDGMSPKDVASSLDISLATLYRWVPAAASL